MKILIASKIYAKAIEQLKLKHDVICAFNAPEAELKCLIADRDVLVFRSGVRISADVLGNAPHLKLIVRAGSGLDNIDMNFVEAHNLKLIRVPEPGAKAVAELSFAMMLMLSRDLLRADACTKRGRWIKSEVTGYLLRGKTLGIVGTGNIGSLVGQMGAAWGMNVIGCVDRSDCSEELKADLRAKGIRLTSFDEVIETADYLSIHVPLTNKTRNLLGAAELARMKPGAFLTNLARGGVVNEEALYKELTTEGRLAGAGVDVHVKEGEGQISPLAELPNVVLTPHIGANAIDSQKEIGRIVNELVESLEQGTI